MDQIMHLAARPLDINDFFFKTADTFRWLEKVIGENTYKPSKIFDNQSFPRMNLVDSSCVDEDTKKEVESFTIELALAGYRKEDLKVSVKNKVLHVSTERNEETKKSENKYYIKGITDKNFDWSFPLIERAEVSEVKMDNGILSIKVKLKPNDHDVDRIEIL